MGLKRVTNIKTIGQHGSREPFAGQGGFHSLPWYGYSLGEGRNFTHLDGMGEEVYQQRKSFLYHYTDPSLE
ncbi:MAG: hypothetical protein ACYDG6_01295 [Thermincolia bacterium]